MEGLQFFIPPIIASLNMLNFHRLEDITVKATKGGLRRLLNRQTLFYKLLPQRHQAGCNAGVDDH
jgi:hypothetical protein